MREIVRAQEGLELVGERHLAVGGVDLGVARIPDVLHDAEGIVPVAALQRED